MTTAMQRCALWMAAGALAAHEASFDDSQPQSHSGRVTQSESRCWTSYATRPVDHVQTRSALTTIQIHYQTARPTVSLSSLPSATATDSPSNRPTKTPIEPRSSRPRPHRRFRRRRADTGPQYPAAVFCSDEIFVFEDSSPASSAFKATDDPNSLNVDITIGDTDDESDTESNAGDDDDNSNMVTTSNGNSDGGNGGGGGCGCSSPCGRRKCGCTGSGSNTGGSHADGYSQDNSGVIPTDTAIDNSNTDAGGASDSSDSRIDASHGKVDNQRIIINRIRDSFNNSFNNVCKYFVNYIVNNYVVNNYNKR